MLAMKCISARFDLKDGDDVLFLMRHLELSSVEAVLALVEKFYPKGRIPPKAHLFLEELVERNF